MTLAVSIIGAGNCGCALAADLASRGANTLLYAHPAHRRQADEIQRGGLKARGKIEGRFRPEITSNMEDVVRFSKYIVVAVPSYGHRDILDELSRFRLHGHVLIAITGNFFALQARDQIDPAAIFETSTSPYASRMQGGEVLVMGIKNVLPIAALPAATDSQIRDEIGAIFSMPLEWRSNVLEIGLSCITGVIHPAPALLNTGWIETTKGNFYFYREGMSPSVGEVIDAVDRDRVRICRQYGFDAPSVVDIMNGYYGRSCASFTEFARETPEHNMTKMTPVHMRDRFIVQDVPFVLVPWYELGLKVGIHSPAIKSLINLASIINRTNYLETGRNLRSLGLDGASKPQILHIVDAPPQAPADYGRIGSTRPVAGESMDHTSHGRHR